MSSHVIMPNRAHAALVTATLRERELGPFVDPTLVPDFIGWDQHDYRFFWGSVIEHFVARVVFVDHWEFSSGCAYEFLIASRKSVPCFDERGNQLLPEQGRVLIENAIGELAGHGLNTEFLSQVRDALTRSISRAAAL
jgi:hypothetical protein